MISNTKQYDVVFVDDDEGMRKLISEELGRINCNVRCFSNGDDCLKHLAKKECHLLITDVIMPGMDGMDLLSRVRRLAPWVPVMMVSGFADIPMSVRAFKLGAVDFIEKPLDRKAFLHKVKAILKQNDYIDTPASHTLTKTEEKILKLILDGKGNKEVAYILDRAVRTVERHRSNVMRKFGVDNIVDLVKTAALTNIEDVQ